MLTPWPHQLQAVKDVMDATMRQVRRILLTSPTGGGKSLIMQLLAKEWLERKGKVILYSNRKLMVEQLSEGLTAAGLYHGVRAAGYEDERDHNFQISSIQTEHSMVHKRKLWNLHEADLVLVDEAHIQTGNVARTILKAHYEAGAAIVLVTATPLGLEDLADELIIAGTMSELRACGALVWAVHYGPDEPDIKAFQKKAAATPPGQDPSAAIQRKAIMTPTIFGRVWEWYTKLNPDQKPCLLFGPGVDESLWFAERFASKGVKAAHIDGNDVWMNGKFYKSDEAARREVREMHRVGELKVVSNRYVLREGVDWPWIEHIILAFVAGSLQTYLQTVGRGLRASPATGKQQLVIQDHGGAWWRHGSINLDRHWELRLTDAIAFGLRAEKIRNKRQEPPFRCPKCGRVWNKGTTCLPAHGGCGFVLGNKRVSRPVVTTDGQLREMTGPLFRARPIMKSPRGPAIWERMYWRSCQPKAKHRTFMGAMALFAAENNWQWPDRSWPFMPTQLFDLFAPVNEVPISRLIQKGKAK